MALLALLVFAGGVLAGVLLERRSRGSEAAAGPFDDYRALFMGHFELSPERTRLFGQVLGHYERELEGVRQRALEDSMGTLEPELVRLGLRYRDLIRNHVLAEADRAEFDRLATAASWPPAVEPGGSHDLTGPDPSSTAR